MKSLNKNTLIWIVVILAITNISTVGTILYRAYFEKTKPEINYSQTIKIPQSRLGRFFRNELNLNIEQHRKFRQFRQEFHAKANIITAEMQKKRNEMLNELAEENSDTAHLHKLAEELGDLHEDLKHLTFEYYLNMKSICNAEQKEKLFEIFKSMTNGAGEINMPAQRQNSFQKINNNPKKINR
ncbi:MAG: periplasmic heavy metal sensor [Chlorobi bacterium]|nr:periplasmic heavy metal sensor [Chlorobiota bacterium]